MFRGYYASTRLATFGNRNFDPAGGSEVKDCRVKDGRFFWSGRRES